eukprot:CAMPEP_0194331690 /NCGR_PEP_ID=MMETSP0171-20130528/56463_1 /TAXON_ID=218684 /ORGANISM="Corethron pennatum, Strain L29A3" /LENGTH=388 /DNA_ID=CAMNT_0039093253 /DNA_START=1180 /DNA_END=2346 /DNA_ORIENTATION=-
MDFHEWFNNSTQQKEILRNMSTDYPNSKDFFIFKENSFTLFELTSNAPTSVNIINLTKPTEQNLFWKNKQTFTIVGVIGVGVIILSAAIVRKIYDQRRISNSLTGSFDIPETCRSLKVEHQEERFLNRADLFLREISSNSLPSNLSKRGIGNLSSTPSETFSESDSSSDFDEVSHKSLEKMRNNIKYSFKDGTEMLSEAFIRALMDDVYTDSGLNNMVLETDILCNTVDWLRQNENPLTEERQAYLQKILNLFVWHVRCQTLDPDCASDTVHRCAVLLGLQIAKKFPENTIIVTGTRKTCPRATFLHAFKKFGNIENGAVASGDRGFGVIRFKSSRSVQNVIDIYKKGEIVVQDVAVSIKILKQTTAHEIPSENADELSKEDLMEANL